MPTFGAPVHDPRDAQEAQAAQVLDAADGPNALHPILSDASTAESPPGPTHHALLPCRPIVAPPPEPTFCADSWLPLATAHTPARSGRRHIHARMRASGAASHPNRGIGRGFALGTELALADFRESTTVCHSPDCAALMDEHWLRRSRCESCGWCRGLRSNIGKHIRNQLKMADALEDGTRRLVVWVLQADPLLPDLTPFTLPPAAVTQAVTEVRARVSYLRAHPPRRGRPPNKP